MNVVRVKLTVPLYLDVDLDTRKVETAFVETPNVASMHELRHIASGEHVVGHPDCTVAEWTDTLTVLDVCPWPPPAYQS